MDTWQTSRSGNRSAEPEPLPREGQIGDSFLAAVGVARRAEGLEAAVEHERVRVERAALEPGGERHLGNRLARPRPERVQRAEGGAEIDPDRGLGAVVGREVHRRERGLQALDIERRGSGRRARWDWPGAGPPRAASSRPRPRPD